MPCVLACGQEFQAVWLHKEPTKFRAHNFW